LSAVVTDWRRRTIWDGEEAEKNEFFDGELLDHVRQEHDHENKYVRP
jgi:hypothetical protein